VDVIEHQAVSHDAKACFGAVECQQIEIHAAIGIRKKGSLPVRAALGDMVRGTRNDKPGVSRHQPQSRPEPARFSKTSRLMRKKQIRLSLGFPWIPWDSLWILWNFLWNSLELFGTFTE